MADRKGEIMVQQISIVLLGLFLLGEAIAAAAAMHKGDSLIRLCKYLFTGVSVQSSQLAGACSKSWATTGRP